MKQLLIEWQELNKQGGSVRTGRGGGSSVVAIHLVNVPGGNQASETIEYNKI